MVVSDYQGEIQVLITNGTTEEVYIRDGDRIAQAVIAPIYQVKFDLVEEFNVKSERGESGFGSTGGSVAPNPPELLTWRWI